MSSTIKHTANDHGLDMTTARGTRILERNNPILDAIQNAQKSVETLRMPLALTIPDRQTSLQFNNMAAQAANALNKAHAAIAFMSDITAALMPYGPNDRITEINILCESSTPDCPFEITAAAVCQRLYDMDDGQSLTVTRCGKNFLVQFDNHIDADQVTRSEFCGYLTQDEFDCLYDIVDGSEISYSYDHIDFRPFSLRRIDNTDQLMAALAAIEKEYDESYMVCLVPDRQPDHFVMALFNGQSHGFVIDYNKPDALAGWVGTMPTMQPALPFAVVKREAVEASRDNKWVSLDVIQISRNDERDAMLTINWLQ